MAPDQDEWERSWRSLGQVGDSDTTGDTGDFIEFPLSSTSLCLLERKEAGESLWHAKRLPTRTNRRDRHDRRGGESAHRIAITVEIN